ncbi:nodal-related 2 [Megalops cyprinoides]|uniref:nodal-related 2 n=1 Tax=Megalops cyprinoides TaxID=118141 RepID=UPI0018651C34|nr:nodal-related 2 [Megalops cyprinoides]
MHALGALSVLLCFSLKLVAAGFHKTGDGGFNFAHRSTSIRSPGHHLPTYMMHLYRNFKANQSPSTDLLEQRTVSQADTVRSVIAKSLIRRGHRWIATFDFSSFLAEEQLQMAELRIRLPRVTNITDVTVEIYHQHEYPCQRSGVCREHHHMGSLSAPSVVDSSQSWKVFNVTRLLLDWLKEQLVFGKKRLPVTKRGPSISNPALLASSKGYRSVNDRALLVAFSHVGSDEGSQAKASLLHTAEQSKFLFGTENKKLQRLKRHKSNRGRRAQPIRSVDVPRRGNTKSLCRKVDLHIDFNQIGWGSWIVFPKRYNAYRCEGTCPNPVGEDFKPTNHAYMQSLLKYYHPDRVPSACCAPTKMSPLSMLYYENGEVLLRHHEDMIVDECGCH